MFVWFAPPPPPPHASSLRMRNVRLYMTRKHVFTQSGNKIQQNVKRHKTYQVTKRKNTQHSYALTTLTGTETLHQTTTSAGKILTRKGKYLGGASWNINKLNQGQDDLILTSPVFLLQTHKCRHSLKQDGAQQMRMVAIVHRGRVGPHEQLARQYPVGLHSRTHIRVVLLVYDAETVQFGKGAGLAQALSIKLGCRVFFGTRCGITRTFRDQVHVGTNRVHGGSRAKFTKSNVTYEAQREDELKGIKLKTLLLK